MPKLKNRFPKNCRDRNQAFSWYNGKRVLHGVWGSPEADKNYKRFIAALLENPNLPLQMGSVEGVLVSELVAGFLKHIEARNMDKTDVEHFKTVVGFLVGIYGELGANEFSPKKLKVVRSQMVKAGTLSRPMINRYIGKIRRIFAWGVEEEVVQSNVIHALRTVTALRKGEEGTFDNPPRQDVPDDVVSATLPYLSPTVRVMVIIQRLTGCRPSEICRMTVESIDRGRKNGLWYYVLQTHKTKKYIGVKQIPLGQAEQVLIEPYLAGKQPSAAVFSPKTAMAELNAERRENRKTKVSPSQQMRDRERADNPADRQPGEFYDTSSYRKAIEHGIRKGNRNGVCIPKWSPYSLRHSAGTEISRTAGKDKAKALLAHKSIRTTEIYDHSDLKVREELARNRRNPFAVDRDE